MKSTATCCRCWFFDTFGCFDNLIDFALLQMLLFVVINILIGLRAHEQTHFTKKLHLTVGSLKAGKEVALFVAGKSRNENVWALHYLTSNGKESVLS